MHPNENSNNVIWLQNKLREQLLKQQNMTNATELGIQDTHHKCTGFSDTLISSCGQIIWSMSTFLWMIQDSNSILMFSVSSLGQSLLIPPNKKCIRRTDRVTEMTECSLYCWDYFIFSWPYWVRPASPATQTQ